MPVVDEDDKDEDLHDDRDGYNDNGNVCYS